GGGPQAGGRSGIAGGVRRMRAQALQAGFVQVDGRYAGAQGEQLPGDGGTDAAGGAGHEDVAVREIGLAVRGRAGVGQGVHAGISRAVGAAAPCARASRIWPEVRLAPQRRATWRTAMRCSARLKSAQASMARKGWMSSMKASSAVVMQPMWA